MRLHHNFLSGYEGLILTLRQGMPNKKVLMAPALSQLFWHLGTSV
jgi:hypothetical protein